MKRNPLREDLEQLQEELQRTKSLDVESRVALEEMMEEIRETLARAEDEDHDSMIGRLRDAMRQFEESHPTLTAAVGRVADALSNMGI